MIAWLEFELAYFESAVQHVSHYILRISLNVLCFSFVSQFKKKRKKRHLLFFLVIAWLEFELAYFESAVQHVSHYILRISLNVLCFSFVSQFKKKKKEKKGTCFVFKLKKKKQKHILYHPKKQQQQCLWCYGYCHRKWTWQPVCLFGCLCFMAYQSLKAI